MPIGDLLNQISGGKSSSSPCSPAITHRPGLSRENSVPAKRKPDTDLRHDAAKSSRPSPLPQALSQRPRVKSEAPPQPQRPADRKGAKPASLPSAKLASAPPRLSKPAVAARSQQAAATPSPTTRAPPKKGSFAEILARGQRAQAVMGQVGKIQHKKVEKGAVKSKEETKAAPPVKRGNPSDYKGTSKPIPKSSTNGNGSQKKASPGTQTARAKTGTSSRATEPEAAVRKEKKAAQATTGYTGTARPKPGNPARANDASRGGALLNAPMSRQGSFKRSRLQDDYDEDMDDFIDYDDDEDDGGPQYGYASDGSSDMEAGMDELDVEERRAETLARKEDIEQERLERTLKMAKEEKKRKALADLRASHRR